MSPMPPIFTPRGSSLLCSPDSCHGPSIGGEHRAGISLRFFHGTPEGFYILPSSSFFVLIPMWIFFWNPRQRSDPWLSFADFIDCAEPSRLQSWEGKAVGALRGWGRISTRPQLIERTPSDPHHFSVILGPRSGSFVGDLFLWCQHVSTMFRHGQIEWNLKYSDETRFAMRPGSNPRG